jgi:hypothetical protein
MLIGISAMCPCKAPSLANYLREGERLELLHALAERGTLRGRWELAKVWEAMFPLVEPATNRAGYGIILLDSNAPSNFSLTNAIGVVNPAQLRAQGDSAQFTA